VLRVFGIGLFCCLTVCWRVLIVLFTLGLVCHGCRVFVLECKVLAREFSPRLALCDVFCCLRLCCAHRLACRLFVLFCSWKVVAMFVVFCAGLLCVMIFWMFGGCSWFVCVLGGDEVSVSE